MLITDHSSIGFEYLLLDRPIVLVEVRQLIARARHRAGICGSHRRRSTTVHDAAGVMAAVDAVSDPTELSDVRRRLAADLFHGPGQATYRAVDELYTLIELDVPACEQPAASPTCVGLHRRGVCRGERTCNWT